MKSRQIFFMLSSSKLEVKLEMRRFALQVNACRIKAPGMAYAWLLLTTGQWRVNRQPASRECQFHGLCLTTRTISGLTMTIRGMCDCMPVALSASVCVCFQLVILLQLHSNQISSSISALLARLSCVETGRSLLRLFCLFSYFSFFPIAKKNWTFGHKNSRKNRKKSEELFEWNFSDWVRDS